MPPLDLVEYLWDNRVFIDDNTLSVNITRIREKLKSIGAMFAMLISGSVILRISRSFIVSTGVHTSVFQYFSMTVLLFLGIYLIYFLATYVGFKRNIYSKD